MPAKKDKETPEAQIERFRKAVRDLVDAGELNPTEAESAFERLIETIELSSAKKL